jgi:hypothetical protein
MPYSDTPFECSPPPDAARRETSPGGLQPRSVGRKACAAPRAGPRVNSEGAAPGRT